MARAKEERPDGTWKTEFIPGPPSIAIDHLGSGPLVVFMHGIGGNRTNWHDQLPVFARKFHAASWDARGYGASDDYAGPLDFADFGRDLLRVLDHFKLVRAHLVGLSMGGLIAFDFHATHSDRVATLTICDSMPGMTGLSEEGRREFIRHAPGAAFEWQGAARHRAGGRENAGWKIRPTGIIRAAGREHGGAAQGFDLKTIVATTNYARKLELENIYVPTHIVVGDEDTLTPPALSRAMASRIPGARLSLIKGAGHLSNIEQPAAFNAATLPFLLEHRESAA